MARIVADSTTLILLAKCSLLGILCEFLEVVIPPSVSMEVASAELVRQHPDAALISALISKGAITVRSVDVPGFTVPLSLDQGEQDALMLALQLDKSLFTTDDGKAIKAARFLGVPFIISPKIVVELYRLEKVSFKKARESLEKLAKIGRYSPEIIADALAQIMEEKDGETHDHKDTRKPPE